MTIITHELGHFFAARAMHIEADTISLGFGPKIIGWQIEPNLEIRISYIPLGGYVSFSDNGEKELAQKAVYQRIIVYSAGIGVNWLLPVVVLLLCSPQYRKFNARRTRYPTTLLRKDLLQTRRFRSVVIGPFFFLRALATPIPMRNNIVEEYAWKFNDLSRTIGYFNILPILGFDGYHVLMAIISMFITTSFLQSCAYFISLMIIWDRWNKIKTAHPHLYRALL